MPEFQFDTIRMVEQLTEAGVPGPQAKAQTLALNDVIKAHDGSLGGRFSNQSEMRAEFAALEARFAAIDSKFAIVDARFVELRADMRAEFAAVDGKFVAMDGCFAEMRGTMAALRGELRQEIAESKSELIRWVVSVGILQMALVAGLLLKLVH